MYDINKLVDCPQENDGGMTLDVYKGEYKGITFILKAQAEKPGSPYDEADYWEIKYYKEDKEVLNSVFEKWYSVKWQPSVISQYITEDVNGIIAEGE